MVAECGDGLLVATELVALHSQHTHITSQHSTLYVHSLFYALRPFFGSCADLVHVGESP